MRGDRHESFFMFAQRRMCTSGNNMLTREGASRHNRWGVGADSPSFTCGGMPKRVSISPCCCGASLRPPRPQECSSLYPSLTPIELFSGRYLRMTWNTCLRPAWNTKVTPEEFPPTFPDYSHQKREYYQILCAASAATLSLTLASMTAAIVAASWTWFGISCHIHIRIKVPNVL